MFFLDASASRAFVAALIGGLLLWAPTHTLRRTRTLVYLTLRLGFLVVRGSPLWIVMVVKLIMFALALSPALASSVWYWLIRVKKNVPYGPGLRHLVDIYLPKGDDDDDTKRSCPAVIFVTGGAWIIGYKAWAVPLGRALSAQGVVVIAPDYRNCPQARVDGMLEDVDRAVGWVFDNAEELGVDRRKIVLAGQSAGAHLCALLLLRRAEEEPASYWRQQPRRSWRPSDVAGFVGVSGPYHLEATAVHWIARGFNEAIFRWVFDNDLEKNSPTHECSRLLERKKKLQQLPRVSLVHGTADQSAPSVGSELFEARLRLLGVRVEATRKLKDWTHTDPILEKPFAGDHSLHAHIYARLIAWIPRDDETHSRQKRPCFDSSGPDCRRLAPQILLDIGHWCMPF